MEKWFQKKGNSGEVVISSRIRLARNLADYNFQEKLQEEDAAKLVNSLKATGTELENREGQKFFTCTVNGQSEMEKSSLVEWHIISPELRKKNQTTGLILSEDESISIMLNEDDHIRIQTVCSGLDMKSAWQTATRIDDIFEQRVNYAYSDRFGYLTSCPTNVGTGLRASYMLFLPALTLGQMIEKLADEVGKYGVVIRGLYGEGTKSRGFLYQITNQKTLGCSEQDIIGGLTRVVMQVIEEEKRYRSRMLENDFDNLTDKVFRSYGVLRYAKYLTSQDAMMLLAQLKLGHDLGLIELKTSRPQLLHQLMMEIQPATIQKKAGKTLGSDERRRFRAEYLNKAIPEIV